MPVFTKKQKQELLYQARHKWDWIKKHRDISTVEAAEETLATDAMELQKMYENATIPEGYDRTGIARQIAREELHESRSTHGLEALILMPADCAFSEGTLTLVSDQTLFVYGDRKLSRKNNYFEIGTFHNDIEKAINNSDDCKNIRIAFQVEVLQLPDWRGDNLIYSDIKNKIERSKKDIREADLYNQAKFLYDKEGFSSAAGKYLTDLRKRDPDGQDGLWPLAHRPVVEIVYKKIGDNGRWKVQSFDLWEQMAGNKKELDYFKTINKLRSDIFLRAFCFPGVKRERLNILTIFRKLQEPMIRKDFWCSTVSAIILMWVMISYKAFRDSRKGLRFIVEKYLKNNYVRVAPEPRQQSQKFKRGFGLDVFEEVDEPRKRRKLNADSAILHQHR